MSVVFDSSAVLAIAFGEHGADRAADALGDGVLSAVNASEVVARLVERGASDEDARESLRGFGLAIRPFDEGLAITAGLLRRSRRTQGLPSAIGHVSPWHVASGPLSLRRTVAGPRSNSTSKWSSSGDLLQDRKTRSERLKSHSYL